MKHLIIAYLILLAGCTNDSMDTVSEESQITSNLTNFPTDSTIPHQSLGNDSENLVVSQNQVAHVILEPPCKPDRFLAHEIPSGYKIDPDCPPEIIWPPRIIFKWDPGPITR
jgi:hypothetical protein